MAVKPSTQIKMGNIPRGISVGLAVSLLCTVLGSAIAAWLLATEKIGEGSVGYITVILLLLCSMLGALASFTSIRQKRLPVCLISGGAYLLLLFGINALFFRGTYSGVGESVLVILAGVLTVAILGLKDTKRPKRKKKI